MYFVGGCKELKLRMTEETRNKGKGKARIIHWEKKKSYQKIHLFFQPHPAAFHSGHSLLSCHRKNDISFSYVQLNSQVKVPPSPSFTQNYKRWYLPMRVALVLFDQALRYPPQRFWTQYDGSEWNFVYSAHLKIQTAMCLTRNNVLVNLDNPQDSVHWNYSLPKSPEKRIRTRLEKLWIFSWYFEACLCLSPLSIHTLNRTLLAHYLKSMHFQQVITECKVIKHSWISSGYKDLIKYH